MKSLLDHLAAKADEAEVFSLDVSSAGVGFSNNRLKSASNSQNSGIALRLIKDGRLAQSSSSNAPHFMQFGERMLALARYGEKAGFHLPQPSPVQALDLYDSACERFSPEDMIDLGYAVIAEMQRYDSSILTFCGGGVEVEHVRVLNSQGVDAGYRRSTFSLSLGGQLVEGNNVLFVYRFYTGLHPRWGYREMLAHVIEDFEIARHNVAFQGKKAAVIFTPAAMADILMTLEEGVNGLNVAKGTSPLINKIGAKLFDERLTLYDDPLHPDGVNSNPVDDEGAPSARLPIVQQGVLSHYITDCKQAAKLGASSTGNGYRRKALLRTHGYAMSVSPHHSNVVMAPGAQSYQSLLQNMDNGLVVENITGILLGNLINGDFSGTIGLGYKVQDGKRVGRVKDTMISGNFYRLFSEQLLALSQEQQWTGALGGDVGSYLLPWCQFRDVDVASKNPSA